MIEEHSVSTATGRITYRADGPEDAPALVFLHGIGGGAGLFAPQLEALAADHRVVAWNMPGYGGSDPIPPAGIDGYARALAAFLEALGFGPTAPSPPPQGEGDQAQLDGGGGWPTEGANPLHHPSGGPPTPVGEETAAAGPILVGHSIGGMVVQSYLAEAMGPARAAVLAQTTPAFGGKDPRWAEDFVAARLEPLDRGETMASLAGRSVAAMVGEDPDPAGLAIAREAIAATSPEAFRASTLAMIGFDRREALGRIAVPTLLIAGSRDGNAPAPTMAKMAERIPGSRLEVLEGCGHLVMLERPAVFTAFIRTFVAELGAAA